MSKSNRQAKESGRSSTDPPIPSRVKLWLIHLFLLVYFGVAAVHMSQPGPLQARLLPIVAPLCSILHIDQHWGMFAAPLRDYNEQVEAFITYADGSTGICEFTRFNMLDPWEQWRHGKLRELLFDTILNLDAYKSLYPSICRFVASASANPTNQPEQISVGGNWARIPPIDKACPYDQLPQNNLHTTMFTYKVSPGDLQ
jgi:hypothetical protein